MDLSEFLKEPEPVEYDLDPVCQELLQTDLSPSEKITEMVSIYLKQNPEFFPPDEELNHPSYLALYRPIKYWMLKQCGGQYGGNVELWTLMLAAAKEWFPDKSETKLGHVFCVRFELEDCTWWNGRTEFQPVLKDYIKWHYDRDM